MNTKTENKDQTTRVLIVEDHVMIRQVFSRILSSEEDVDVVGTAGTIAEAKELIRATCPDLVLVDIMLPDGSGIDLIQYLTSEHPEMKAILLTALQDEESVLSGVEAGVDGYVVKSSTFESLVQSIRLVMSGKQVYDPVIVSPIFQRLVRSTPMLAHERTGTNSDALSARQREIIRLISRGLTNKEIAQALSLSVHTVKTHVRQIFRRLEISSRRELLSSRHLPPDLL